MRTLFLVLASSMWIDILPAQQATVPPALASTPGVLGYHVFTGQPTRAQCTYGSYNFTSQGINHAIEIDNLEFRAQATLSAPWTYPSVEIYLEYSGQNFLTQSAAFVNNRTLTQPRPPNFAGPLSIAAGAAGTYFINVPLAIPFSYDPTSGADLLVEIVVLTAANSGLIPVDTAQSTNATRLVYSNGTTAPIGSFDSAPVLRFTYLDLSVPGAARHESYGAGCYVRQRSWYEQFVGPGTNDLTGRTVRMEQNGLGGYDVSTQPLSTFVNPTGVGLAIGDDAVTPPISLPFTFDYPGGSANSIIVDSNGRIIINATGTVFSNNANYTPTSILGARWVTLSPSAQDLMPDGPTNTANVFVAANGPAEFLITWWNVPCYNVPLSAARSTFQVALIDNGTNDAVEFRYVSLANDSSSFNGLLTVGYSNGLAALDPGNRDLTALGRFSTGADTGTLGLDAWPRPILGNPVSYSLQNVRTPAGVSAVNIGFASTLPVPLPTYGLDAPNCFGHIDVLGSVPFGPLLIGAPRSTFTWTWPAGPYGGTVLYAQGFELAPLENPSGVITSNGLRITLGTL